MGNHLDRATYNDKRRHEVSPPSPFSLLPSPIPHLPCPPTQLVYKNPDAQELLQVCPGCPCIPLTIAG